MSDSLRPHELQHARPPCPSPTPGVYSNSCPLSQRCHPTISSSVVPFSSCPQSFPASGSFPMSQLFSSGGQSIGVSASTSVLPMNTQDWSPLGWTGWISLQSKGIQISPPFDLPSRSGHHRALNRVPCATQYVLIEAVLFVQSCPTLRHQTPLSMGFSRQEYWSGLPFPPPGNLADSGIELRSPELQADSLPSELSGKPYFH